MLDCQFCKTKVEEWNAQCRSCGFRLLLEPDEQRRAKFLRAPSLGALLWTQGWALGARLYLWFALSLIPIVGIPVMILLVLFGRRWSWKYGGWSGWQEFRSRMRLMDLLAVLWIAGLILAYFLARK